MRTRRRPWWATVGVATAALLTGPTGAAPLPSARTAHAAAPPMLESLAVGGGLAAGLYVLLRAPGTDSAESASSAATESSRQWGLARINAPAAHAVAGNTTGRGARLAIADTEIAVDHSDLDDQLVTANGGGYGLDLLDDANGGAAVTGDDFGDHGTHVAGIAAAERNNRGIHGVAYDAGLVPYTLIPSDSFTDDAVKPRIATMLDHAVSNDVDVINNSWGSRSTVEEAGPPSHADEWQQAVTNDIAIVFAAGNQGGGGAEPPDNPNVEAGLPHYDGYGAYKDLWVAVTAVDSIAQEANSDDPTTGYANHCGVAKAWCIAAPGGTQGQLISSTGKTTGGTEFLRELGGTSMAAPHVAGAIAVLQARFDKATTAEVIDHMFATADDSAPYNDARLYGHGLLDLHAAIGTPMGALGVVGPNGTWTRLTASGLRAPAAVGDGLALALADTALGTRDRFGGTFRVAGTSVLADTPANRASRSALERARRRIVAAPAAPTGGRLGPLAGLVAGGAAVPVAAHDGPRGGWRALAYRGATRQDSAATGALLRRHRRRGPWRLALRTGVLAESAAWLGGGGRGAFALDGSRAGTVHAGTRLTRRLSADSRLVLRLQLGRTALVGEPAGSLVKDIGPAWTSSWRLAWQQTGLLGERDQLTLGFRQPLRVETGQLALAWPEPGGGHQARRLDLEPTGRTVRAGARYRARLSDRLRAGLALGVTTEPGHRAGATPRGYLGVHLQSRF